MGQLKRAVRFVDQYRGASTEASLEHREAQVLKWMRECHRLGIPLRTIATCAGLKHPEEVRRAIRPRR